MSSLFGFGNNNSSTTSSNNTRGATEHTKKTGSAEEAGQVHKDAVAESTSGAPNQSTTTTTTTASRSNPNSGMNDSSRMNMNERGQFNNTNRSSDTTGALMSEDNAMTRSEEQLRVGKESVEAGKARLHKYVTSERVETDVPLQSESVRLEREPITDANRDAAMSGPEIKEAEYEVGLKAERPVVQKETVPIERVRLSKQQETQTQTVGDELRAEHIEYGTTAGVRTNQSQMQNNAATARDNSVQGA